MVMEQVWESVQEKTSGRALYIDNLFNKIHPAFENSHVRFIGSCMPCVMFAFVALELIPIALATVMRYYERKMDHALAIGG